MAAVAVIDAQESIASSAMRYNNCGHRLARLKGLNAPLPAKDCLISMYVLFTRVLMRQTRASEIVVSVYCGPMSAGTTTMPIPMAINDCAAPSNRPPAATEPAFSGNLRIRKTTALPSPENARVASNRGQVVTAV